MSTCTVAFEATSPVSFTFTIWLRTIRGAPGGVGSSNVTNNSYVNVNGGLGKHPLSIKAIAAVQFPWQSNNAETIPPLTIPGKAQYFKSNETEASSPPGTLKLRKCKPSGAAGPHPKQALSGVYATWTQTSSSLSGSIPASVTAGWRGLWQGLTS